MEIVMRKDPEELHQIFDRLIEQVKAAADELKGARGVAGVLFAVPSIVRHVQILGDEYKLVGEDKKELATEAVLYLIPDRWCPDWILRPMVSWAIEKAVAEVKRNGSAGLQKLKDLVSKRLG